MDETRMTPEARFFFIPPKGAEGEDLESVVWNAFGQFMVQMVRDRAIADMKNTIIYGYVDKLGEKPIDLKTIFNHEQLVLLTKLIARTTDETIHHMLWS